MDQIPRCGCLTNYKLKGKDIYLTRSETDMQMVKEAFRERFRTKTKAEWTEIFRDKDACVEPVLSLSEAAEDEQLTARGMWPEVPLYGQESDIVESSSFVASRISLCLTARGSK